MEHPDRRPQQQALILLGAAVGAVNGKIPDGLVYTLAGNLRRLGLEADLARHHLALWALSVGDYYAGADLDAQVESAYRADIPPGRGALARAGVNLAALDGLTTAAAQPARAAVWHNAADLDRLEAEGRLESTSWLVPDVIPQPGFVAVVGPSSAGKSTVAYALAIASVGGGSWLGLATRLCPTALIVAAEGARDRIRGRLRRTSRGLGLNWDADIAPNLHIAFGRLGLDEAGDVAGLRASIAERKPSLLVLDPMRDLYAGEENNADAISKLTGTCRDLVTDFGLTVLLVHHASPKLVKDRKLTINNVRWAVRGSTALDGALDTIIGVVSLTEAPELGDDGPPAAIEFDAAVVKQRDGDRRHLGRWAVYHDQDAIRFGAGGHCAGADCPLAPIERAVLGLLTEAPRSLRALEGQKPAGAGRNKTREAHAHLRSRRRVESFSHEGSSGTLWRVV